MKKILFSKMQGTGNDYVYINALNFALEAPEKLAIELSDRHFGVGSDGLVLITSSNTADFGMRMFNADGSEAGMCGNASRCVGKYLYERGLTDKKQIALETKSGIKYLSLRTEGNKVKEVSVDMGKPILSANDIPVNYPWNCNIPLYVCGKPMLVTCVSMGNPHAVTFVDKVAKYDVENIGRSIENNPIFPERSNVEFIEVLSEEEINMRVWERGSGETLACGTGACASVVAAVLNGYCARRVKVHLIGGDVTVEWKEDTDSVILTGDAEWVFDGEYLLKN